MKITQKSWATWKNKDKLNRNRINRPKRKCKKNKSNWQMSKIKSHYSKLK